MNSSLLVYLQIGYQEQRRRRWFFTLRAWSSAFEAIFLRTPTSPRAGVVNRDQRRLRRTSNYESKLLQ
jgi:hypothetical protein